jgi:hypothetical protein
MGTVTHGDDQSDPGNYDYFVLQAPAAAAANPRPLKMLSIRTLFEQMPPVGFADLAATMYAAADEFLDPPPQKPTMAL